MTALISGRLLASRSAIIEARKRGVVVAGTFSDGERATVAKGVARVAALFDAADVVLAEDVFEAVELGVAVAVAVAAVVVALAVDAADRASPLQGTLRRIPTSISEGFAPIVALLAL